MPQNPIRWMMTILFLTLVGLTLWIVWAMEKLEERMATKEAVPWEVKSVPTEETPNSKSSSLKE